MPSKVLLYEVVDALEMQMEETSAFVNRETGEILVCTEEEKSTAEDEHDETAPQWMKESLPKIREAFDGEPWHELPDKFAIHDWEIMRSFADEQTNENHFRELQNAIHGKGAFRMFRDTLRRLGLQEKWDKFHHQQMETIAIEWLEENNIPFSRAPRVLSSEG